MKKQRFYNGSIGYYAALAILSDLLQQGFTILGASGGNGGGGEFRATPDERENILEAILELFWKCETLPVSEVLPDILQSQLFVDDAVFLRFTAFDASDNPPISDFLIPRGLFTPYASGAAYTDLLEPHISDEMGEALANFDFSPILG